MASVSRGDILIFTRFQHRKCDFKTKVLSVSSDTISIIDPMHTDNSLKFDPHTEGYEYHKAEKAGRETSEVIGYITDRLENIALNNRYVIDDVGKAREAELTALVEYIKGDAAL